MKSSIIPVDGPETAFKNEFAAAIPRGGGMVDSRASRTSLEESSLAIPKHPLGVKPAGNSYTATSNAKTSIGPFQLFPDEIIAIFLEYLDAAQLRGFGSTCRFLYAFCRSDDLWKALFIE
jgi:hypothetical protein